MLTLVTDDCFLSTYSCGINVRQKCKQKKNRTVMLCREQQRVKTLSPVLTLEDPSQYRKLPDITEYSPNVVDWFNVRNLYLPHSQVVNVVK